MWEEGVHIYGTPGVPNNFPFQPMAFAPNDSSLSSNQDTNQFLGVGSDWTPDLLFNYQRLYQLS